MVLGSFLVAHLCFILLPNVFEILNARAVDQLFNLRSSWKKFQPFYDNTVVHLDLNNTSIQKLNDLYLNRSHYAQVVRNLSSMGVSAQVFDFILASRKSEKNDRELIDMVKEAGNVYFGTAFELIEDNASYINNRIIREIYLISIKLNGTWRLRGIPAACMSAINPLLHFLI